MAFSLGNSRSGPQAIDARSAGFREPVTAQAVQPAPSSTSAPKDDGSSIIGHDLELRGTDIQIVVRGKLRVDGRIAGEVYGREIVIGREAQVSGRIVAEKVAIHGTVSAGEIHSHEVALMSGSQVEADIHHQRLSIEEGAMFDGRSRRSPDDAVLPTPDDKLTP